MSEANAPSPPRPSLGDRALFLAFVYLAFFVPYTLVNRAIDADRAHDLSLPLDRAIPFVPEFMYPFYLAYVLLPALGLFIRARARLLAAGLAVFVLIASSCAIFVLFPVIVPRPTNIPETLAGRLVSLAYQADRPVCGFPSLHVSMSFATAFIVMHERRLLGTIAMVFAILTSVAVLFIKQHVILDVIAGLAMAAACYGLYRWLVARTSRVPSLTW